MLEKLKCFIFGHQYYVHQELTEDSRRVKCNRCPGDWSMNDRVQCMIPWDDELEAFYRDVFKLRILK